MIRDRGRTPRKRRSAAGLAAGLLCAATPVLACGYHGTGIGDNFSVQHPKSLLVAFALRDAVAAGTLPPSAIEPPKAGGPGYWRAVERLNRLSAAFSKPAAGPALPVSILLVDSQLWARMTPDGTGYALEVHTKGAGNRDVVILTSDAVLAALVDGTMSAESALALGTLIVDGEAESSERVRSHLAAGLAETRGGRTAAPRPVSIFSRARND